MGDAIEPSHVEDAHPDLMPELARELHKAELIEKGRLDALRPSNATATTDGMPRESEPLVGLGVESIPGYRIIRHVSRGGQGTVFEGVQQRTRRRVAIKVFGEGEFTTRDERSRFEREVRVLGALRHPHIVTIHDSGAVRGQFYFVMDYVDGEPLDVHVLQRSLPTSERLRLFQLVCDAVHSAHLRGIIHRDLKPSNIRVDHDGMPCVLDFGLAKFAAGQAGGGTSVTAPGQFVGSLMWASPEQVEGHPDRIDLRTDVYALGVILYQLLTGRFPYPMTGGVREAMDAILYAAPVSPSTLNAGIGNELDTIILKCLSKEPARRYQSAGEVGRDLQHFLTGQPIEAKRDSTWYVLRKTASRYKYVLAAASVLLVLLAAFGIGMSALYHRAAYEAHQNRRLADRLQNLFQFSEPQVAGGRLSVVDLLDEHAEPFARELEDHPEVQVKFLETVSGTYMAFGQPGAALPLLQRVVALHRDTLGSGARTVSQSLARYADALSRVGRNEEAEACYVEAVELMRAETRGPDAELADLLRSYGDFVGYRMGDHTTGLALREESLAIVRVLDPPDERRLASALGSMAGYVHDTGRFAEAERYYLEAIEAYETLGEWKYVGGTRHFLGLLYKDTGRYQKAEAILRSYVEDAEAQYGDNDLALAGPYMSLAKLYADMNRPDLAIKPCQRSIYLYTKQFGMGHETTSEPMTLMGRILLLQKRYDEAIPILRDAHSTRNRILADTNWERAKTATLLGAALAGVGEFEEAEPLLIRNYPFVRDNRRPGHRRTTEALERLVFLYERWGKTREARRWRAELCETASPLWVPFLVNPCDND